MEGAHFCPKSCLKTKKVKIYIAKKTNGDSLHQLSKFSYKHFLRNLNLKFLNGFNFLSIYIKGSSLKKKVCKKLCDNRACKIDHMNVTP